MDEVNNKLVHPSPSDRVKPYITNFEVLKIYMVNDSQSLKVNWNYCGNMLSIAELKKFIMVRNKKRGVWEKIKEIV